MKNSSKKFIRIVAIILVLAGIGVKYQMDKREKIRQEQLKIAKSEEAREIYERDLKWLDPLALTDDGIIKSYEVDYDSLQTNPMGGFSVKLIINDNPDYYIRIGLVSSTLEGGLRSYSWINSDGLDALLGGE